MKQVNRRAFLGASAASVLTASLGTRLYGNPGGATLSDNPYNLIIVLSSGGWDPTYVFDPKPDSDQADTGPGDFLEFGSSAVWVHPDRPSVATFFERYGDITSVINGVSVPSLSHLGCMQRMMTGTSLEGRPDLGTMVAQALGTDTTPIPYLVFGEASYKGAYGAHVGHVGTTSQLRALVDPEEWYPHPTGSEWTRVVTSDSEEAMIRKWVQGRVERERQRLTNAGLTSPWVDDFALSLSRSDALTSAASIFGNAGRRLGLDQQARVSADALQQGISRAILIDGGYRWDTHTDNAAQEEYFESTFANLLILAAELESRPGSSGTLFDDTIVAVVSEMGRAPRLNDTNGKHHWPYTSMMLFGPRVRGYHVSGGSDDGLVGLTVDLETGIPNPQGDVLGSENVIAGILELLELDCETLIPGVTPLRGFHNV